MMWPLLIAVVAVVALLIARQRWRKKLRDCQQTAATELEKLRGDQQEAMQQLRSRQQTVFDSMTDGLLLLDAHQRIQLANRAFQQMFAVVADLRNRTVIEALRVHELPALVDSISSEKPVVSQELKLSGPPERWLEVNAAAILDGARDREGTIMVFHDLTRLKQFERARQEFIANVSHELRTPLSLIKGYVETLLDGAKDNPEVAAKFLQTVARNAERLRLLIEDLLTISELESGQMKLNLQPVALRSVSEKVVADFRARAAARHVSLNDEVPALTVLADPDRIEQVLCNLVDNAIKYGRSGGEVTLRARPEEHDLVEVGVTDDGPGIPAEALDRLFERFYRVDKGRSREQGGTGLGLSIVKHIVQNHGGKAWAASELGKGATFYFTLPMLQREEPRQS